MKRIFPLAFAITLFIYIFSCSSDNTNLSEETDITQEDTKNDDTSTPEESTSENENSQGNDDTTEDETMYPNQNYKVTGASGNDILSAEKYTKIIFDIVYVKGHKPTDETMNHFTEFIEDRTYKEEITYKYTQIESEGKDSYTLDDIVEVEDNWRTIFNTDTTLAVFIFVADVGYSEDRDNSYTLGLAFRNTSIILFHDSIKTIADSSPNIELTTVESGTIQHELGHLFGLVNIGTDMIHDHEDNDAEGHCTDGDCLMQASLEFTSKDKLVTHFEKVQTSKYGVQDFGSHCLEDLQAIGGK